MSISTLLNHWKSDPSIMDNIVEWKIIPPSPGKLEPLPSELHPNLKEALLRLGYDALFSHQRKAWNYVKSGKNVVITTGTGSGKTLCFNLPVLDFLLRHNNARALYLFPTKALAQDQLNILNNYCLELPFGIYDGDTPLKERTKIRTNSRIILSNPDMLHIGILPRHTYWSEFFRDLQFVVVDEIHTYRGVFGSHVANVIRRLNRIARYYGSYPIFILTSATIANPVEFATKLIEAEVVLIDSDGASHGERHFIVYNPPMIDRSLGIRRSAFVESIRLAEDLLQHDVQTIIFSTTRRSVELILKALRERSFPSINSIGNETTLPIRGYRSGYLSSQRREIEKGLREGEIRTVVATNALELGIDIGNMGAVVISGYPGTLAAMRQQSGRASRNTKTSIAIFVPSTNPIDQYLAHHPDYLFDRLPERALINPNNPLILLNHLRCACFELPFTLDESFGRVSNDLLSAYMTFLSDAKEIYHSAGKYFWLGNYSPALNVPLRRTSPDRVVLQCVSDNEQSIIGEVDIESAPWMVHPKAIYIHDAHVYIVDDLDLQNKIALLRKSNEDYLTQPITNTEIQLIGIQCAKETHGAHKYYGEIIVTSQVVGFRRIKWATNETLDVTDMDLPPTHLRTMGYWFSLHNEVTENLRKAGLWNNDPNQYGPNWEIQRQKARERDQFRCQICGIPERGRSHDVHHIRPFRTFSSFLDANQLNNLITLCPTCHQRAEETVRVRSGLSGLAYSISNIAPLLLMCDRHDLGVHTDPNSPLTEGLPTVIIYEMVPAGIGFSQTLFDLHEELIDQNYRLILSCECDDGCPSCVGPGGENGSGSKKETLAILEALLNTHQLA